MPDGFFDALPLGDLETPERRGKFIDIEAFDALIESGTFVDITVSGTSTLNDVTINDASIVDATITNADINGGTFGSATIDGDLVVGAWLSLTTSGGIRTENSTTLQRIEITNAENNTITFYSGATNETDPVLLYQNDNGTGGTRTIQMNLGTGLIDHTGYGGASQIDAKGSFIVRTGSPDGTSFAPGWVFAQTAASSGGGQDLEINIQNSIPLITDGDIYLAAGGAVGFGSSYDDQFYQISDGVLGIKIAGTAIARFSSPAVSTGRLVLGTEANDYIQYDSSNEAWRFAIDDTRVWEFTLSGNESRMFGRETNDYLFNDNSTEEWGFVLDSTEYFNILKSVVIVGAPLFRLPVKGTTGDPTATDEGDMYVNSVDNVLKVYEGGSWRTVATW